MTRKGRSKVRAQEPTPSGCVEPGSIVHPDLQPPPIDDLMEAGVVRVVGPEPLSADAVAAAYGFDETAEFTPEQLIAAIDAVDASEAPREARNTLTDFLPALPSGHGMTVFERVPEAAARLMERAPSLMEEPTESIVKGIIHQIETSPKVRDAIARLMAVNAEITEANGGQEPAAFVIERLWLERLGQMAALAHQSPNQYLQTLLARAWTAMPRRSRVDG